MVFVNVQIKISFLILIMFVKRVILNVKHVSENLIIAQFVIILLIVNLTIKINVNAWLDM